MTWTIDQVLALAPDPASASAGQGLATRKKWTSVGRSDRAVWGLCQGSGKDPYQARIDLGEPAFKCSCPSRKFPCKHGIGLLLLFVKEASAFKTEAEPGWVADWLASRSDRAEKKAEKAAAAAEKPVDLEAQAKRAAKRSDRVQEGVASCRLWLEDLIRKGLAAAKSESSSWDRVAARMVDAQATGLAGMISAAASALNSGDSWDVRTLDVLGRLHLLLAAAEAGDRLPADLAADVRTLLGFPISKDEVLAGPGISDTWLAMGQVITDEGTIRARRTWLVGRTTSRRALILDFAPTVRPFEASLPLGCEFEGELAFYPSRLPMRALVKSKSDTRAISAPLGAAGDRTLDEGLDRYSKALAIDPWLIRWPLLLSGGKVAKDGERWILSDNSGAGLPLRPSFAASLNLWKMIAAGAGRPMLITVEWDGEWADPVGLIDEASRRFCDLAPRWAA